jgi:hypothetical protein
MQPDMSRDGSSRTDLASARHDQLVGQTEVMRFDVEPEPIAGSDDEIRASLVDAPIPPLLASVAHLTGDLSIAREDLRPDLARVLEMRATRSSPRSRPPIVAYSSSS